MTQKVWGHFTVFVISNVEFKLHSFTLKFIYKFETNLYFFSMIMVHFIHKQKNWSKCLHQHRIPDKNIFRIIDTVKCT